MAFDYSKSKSFWNERCKRYGHTGYADQLVYAHDQPIRMKAVEKALSHLGISVGGSTRILDVGCGIGTFVLEFYRKGATVTGIDISTEAIKKARQTLPDKNIRLLVMKAEDIDFPNDSFDVAVCITVLQHITNPRTLSRAIRNIVKVAKWLLILESSPIAPTRTWPPYIAIRTRKEWIDLFEKHDCELVYERPLPQIGLRILGYYARALVFLSSSAKRKKAKDEKKELQAAQSKTTNLSIFGKIGGRLISTILKTIDYLFLYVSYPKEKSFYRILVFKKLRSSKA